MAEQDRDKPHWEPPPWEADVFDAIRRQREAEEADAEIAAALEELETGLEPEPVVVEPPVPVAVEAAQGSQPVAEAPKPALEEARLEAMLIHLKVEEPDATKSAWIVGALSALFVSLVGMVMVIWGLVAFAKVGNIPSGGMGAGILILFGMGFIALAAWLLHRTLKFKGVI